MTDMLAIVCSVANCILFESCAAMPHLLLTHLEWGNSMGAVLNMDCGVGVCMG